MKTNDLDELLDALTDATDMAAVRQCLTEHPAQLTEPFFRVIEERGAALSAAGDLRKALHLFRIGREAGRQIGNDATRLQFVLESAATELQMGRLEGLNDRLITLQQEIADRLDGNNPNTGRLMALSTFYRAQLAEKLGDWALARQLYSDFGQACRAIGWNEGRLHAVMGLVQASHGQGDLRAAMGYALQMSEHLNDLEEASSNGAVSPLETRGISLLYQLAHKLYYEHERYQQALTLLERVVASDPQHLPALELRAHCNVKLDQFEKAAALWEELVSLHPSTESFHNYAGVLSQIGRFQAAMAAAGEAIRLAPSAPRLYFLRGQLYQRLGRHDRAIDDFSTVIRLEAETDTPAEGDHQPQSYAKYQRHMPLRDLADFARMKRIEAFRVLGRAAEAQRDIQHFLTHGDDVMQAVAHALVGDIYMERGDGERAVAAYTRAVVLAPQQIDYRIKRIGGLLSEERHEEAMPDLAFLARRERDPQAAIDILTTVIDRYPKHALARKWRGFAYFERGLPIEAIADLTFAADKLPEDVDVSYWLGLAMVTFDVQDYESEWNRTFNGLRVRDGIVMLGRAATLATEHEAKIAFRWLVDRAALDDRLFTWLQVGFQPESNLEVLFPDVRAAIRRKQDADDAAAQAEWALSTAILQQAIETLVASGFDLLAARLRLDLARNFLRTYDLQSAINQLNAAKRSIFLISRPLTAHLQTEADALAAGSRYGRPLVAVEIDYMTLYGFAYSSHHRLLVSALEAEIWATLGDEERARTAMTDMAIDGDEIAGIAENPFRQGWIHEVLISLANSTFRIGAFEEALDHLDLARQLAVSEAQLHQVHLLNGSIFAAQGDLEAAERLFEPVQAWAQASADYFLAYYVPSTIGICKLHIAQKRYEAAYQLVYPIWLNIDNVRWYSSTQRFEILILVAQLSEALGNDMVARKAIHQAVATVEEMRTELTSIQSRMHWQAAHDAVYRMAVPIMARYGSRAATFDLIELSKGRAFLDTLAIETLPLPESAAGLAETERELLEEKRLLDELMDAANLEGGGFVDFGIICRLQKLGHLRDLQDHKNRSAGEIAYMTQQEMAATNQALSMIRAEIEAARLEEFDASLDNTVSYTELRDLIS